VGTHLEVHSLLGFCQLGCVILALDFVLLAHELGSLVAIAYRIKVSRRSIGNYNFKQYELINRSLAVTTTSQTT